MKLVLLGSSAATTYDDDPAMQTAFELLVIS